MNRSYGWNKIVHDDYVFWFKGYVLDGSFSSIAQSLSVFLLNLNNNNKTLIEFLSCIRGHYSFVIHNDDTLISVVDKVCTIPLFYAEIKDTVIISNNATIIKDKLSLDSHSFDASSILEISMSGYTIGSKTLYRDMKQLTAGEFVCIYDSCFTKQYYQLMLLRNSNHLPLWVSFIPNNCAKIIAFSKYL